MTTKCRLWPGRVWAREGRTKWDVLRGPPYHVCAETARAGEDSSLCALHSRQPLTYVSLSARDGSSRCRALRVYPLGRS